MSWSGYSSASCWFGSSLRTLVGEETTRTSIAGLRDDIADLRGRLDEAEASAESLPHRRKYLLLTLGFLRRLLELHVDFVDEVERELSGESTRGESRQQARTT